MKSPLTPQQITTRNTTFLFVVQAITKFVGFVALIVLANYLNVENFGKYNFALAFASLFIPLCDLGIDTFLTRELAARSSARETFVGTTLVLKTLLSIIVVGIIAGVALLISRTAEYYLLILLAGGVTIVRAFCSSFVALFRAEQRMEFDANSTLVGKLFEVLAIFIAIIAKVNLFNLFGLVLISSVLQLFYTYYIARKNSFIPALSVDKQTALSLLKGGLPFALTGISVMIYFQIDTVLLSFLASEHTVGIYRAATNIVFALSGFSAAVVIALFPMIAQNYERNLENAVKTSSNAIYYSLLFSLPIAFGITLFAQPIVKLIYKESFSETALTLQILVWWLPLMFTTNVLGHILGAVKLQKLVLMVSSFNAIFNILLNLLLIPIYADKGAAMTTVTTELLGLCVLSFFVARYFGSVFDTRKILRLALANLIFLPLMFLNNLFNVFIIIPIGMSLYGLTLFSLKAISKEDLMELKHILISRTPESISSNL